MFWQTCPPRVSLSLRSSLTFCRCRYIMVNFAKNPPPHALQLYLRTLFHTGAVRQQWKHRRLVSIIQRAWCLILFFVFRLEAYRSAFQKNIILAYNTYIIVASFILFNNFLAQGIHKVSDDIQLSVFWTALLPYLAGKQRCRGRLHCRRILFCCWVRRTNFWEAISLRHSCCAYKQTWR